jgi:hypothetical protein
MKSWFSVLFAGKLAAFRKDRTDRSPDNLANPRPALPCSANQLEQLIGKQGHDAKHEVEPNFLGSPHHHGATPELFFQSTVEALRYRPFLVSGRLMGGRGITDLPRPFLSMLGTCPRLRLTS